MALNRRLLETQGEYSDVYVMLFKVVAVILLIIEGIALLIGVRLTRSITPTVDKLYDATERVKKGDFSYRIGVPSNDQISALGEAFDSMTASVERLLRESEEKLRMQSELEIAREVQAQLFPRSAPEVPGLALYGVCKAARTVSGDYYDFLKLGEDRVCLVLGDVSGKGISAALLMAAIQSALRAQFYDGLVPDGGLAGKGSLDRGGRQQAERATLREYAAGKIRDLLFCSLRRCLPHPEVYQCGSPASRVAPSRQSREA